MSQSSAYFTTSSTLSIHAASILYSGPADTCLLQVTGIRSVWKPSCAIACIISGVVFGFPQLVSLVRSALACASSVFPRFHPAFISLSNAKVSLRSMTAFSCSAVVIVSKVCSVSLSVSFIVCVTVSLCTSVSSTISDCTTLSVTVCCAPHPHTAAIVIMPVITAMILRFIFFLLRKMYTRRMMPETSPFLYNFYLLICFFQVGSPFISDCFCCLCRRIINGASP